MKKLVSFILSIVIIVSSCLTYVSAFDFDDMKKIQCSTLPETSDFLFDGGDGEITVTPVCLTEKGKTRIVYYVCVMGMGYNFKKTNNPLATVPAAFNSKTKYYKLVRNTMFKYIPYNSEVILFGHSLGGMVCQQLACDDSVKDSFRITKTMTIGSPYIMVNKDKREGGLVRFADKSDTVPKLSPAFIFDRKDFKDAYFRDGGYNGNPDTSHNLSYRESDVWNCFDALGVENGDASFTYRPIDVRSQTA